MATVETSKPILYYTNEVFLPCHFITYLYNICEVGVSDQKSTSETYR